MQNSNKIKGVKFQPWVGKNYKTGGLLLFGESHYEKVKSNITPNYTTEVVENFLSEEKIKTPFFRNIVSIFPKSNSLELMNDVAFANGIQKCFARASDQPQKKDFEMIASSFQEYVSFLKPSKVLILSKRVWVNWLEEGNWKHIKNLKRGERQSEIWEYSYGERKCYCMGIHHPSRGFSPESWAPLVLEFLNYGLK